MSVTSRGFFNVFQTTANMDSAQQTKCHCNIISGKKLSSSYPSNCLLYVLYCLGKPAAREHAVKDPIVWKGQR